MPPRPSLRPRHVKPCPLVGLAAMLDLDPAPDLAGLAVTGVTHDSRQVRAGDLYAALPGSRTHGASFAAQAAEAGAVAALTDAAGAHLVVGLPVLVVADPRAQLGRVADRVYGEPARDLLVIGVTGTNGKTTTSYLVESGLRAAGHRTGLIGTVEAHIGEERVATERTTPEAPEVHALLALMRERGVTACVMEVSSHALVYGRVDGIVFDVAGFTNLSQDHLDFHTDLEDYFAVKAGLFTAGRSLRGVVVVDDEYGRRLASTESTVSVTTVSTQGWDADWRVVARDHSEGLTRIVMENGDARRLTLTSPIPGDFNVANAALAVILLIGAGVDADDAVRGVAECAGVPGRMERVPAPGGGPLALVDYAHTPDAVETVLRALRPSTSGRLVVVVGAGGDRDPHKRPLMGAAAARNADVVVVTDDNPRSEDPVAIRAAVLAGAYGVPAADRAEVHEVVGRRAAIRAAVEMAPGPADTIAVVGKGHEQGQEAAGVVHPFDDRQVLAEMLRGREVAL
ncbi:MAG: UDP-N-acetylmuramoyl-L-alanyl-D-glutamate--2,6-diaminopimelate ligase [Jiangellaceae bacterium]